MVMILNLLMVECSRQWKTLHTLVTKMAWAALNKLQKIRNLDLYIYQMQCQIVMIEETECYTLYRNKRSTKFSFNVIFIYNNYYKINYP